jgi:hypothetical protein
MGIKEYQFLSSTLQEVAKLNEERLGKIDSLKAAEEKLKGKNGDVKDIEDSIPESEEKIAEYEAALPVAKQHQEASGAEFDIWLKRFLQGLLLWSVLIALTYQQNPNHCFFIKEGCGGFNWTGVFLMGVYPIVIWKILLNVISPYPEIRAKDIIYNFQLRSLSEGEQRFRTRRSDDLWTDFRGLEKEIKLETKFLTAQKNTLLECINEVHNNEEMIIQINNEISELSVSIALKMEEIGHLVPPDTN